MGSREGARVVARPWEEGGRSSTAVARMVRWVAVSVRGGAKRAAFIGRSLAGDVAVTVAISP
jgi:hypothetical protein